MPSLKGQSEKIESELKKTRGGWLSKIDKLWSGLETDLNALATPAQAARGQLKLAKPGRSWIDSDRIDGIIPYFDLTVGICLILGLFTRTAAVAAAAFLFSVMATQPPWVPEVCADLLSACGSSRTIGRGQRRAGKHAGIDAIVRTARRCCCPTKKEIRTNENDHSRRT